MNWLRRILGISEKDRVLLRMHDNEHLLRPVTWYAGIPFAAPYLPHTRCELLPGGKVIGDCYIKGWRPASERMAAFYDSLPMEPKP